MSSEEYESAYKLAGAFANYDDQDKKLLKFLEANVTKKARGGNFAN
jgi:hypothetical protein